MTMLRLLILAAAALLLPLRAQALAVTEIAFWTSEVPPERLAVIRYLADAFMALNPDVRVKVVGYEENEFADRVAASSCNIDAPVLVNTGSNLIVALGERGLVDVKAVTGIITSMGRERFSPGPLTFFSTGRKGYYGIPHHGWVQGLWYRADIFENAGLKPPGTWTAILKAARALTDRDKGIYGILVGTKPDNYAEQVFTQVALSNEARMFSPDGKLIFDSPAMVEALEFYLKLAACTPPGPQTWRGRDYYFQNRLGMFFYSTFILDDLSLSRVAKDSLGSEHFKELAGAEFDPDLARKTRMIPDIRNRVAVSYGSINGFSLLRCDDFAKREAAQRLIAFLYEPGPYVEWLHMSPGGMLPVLRGMAEREAFMRDPEGVFQRFGRDKIKRMLQGLDSIRAFGQMEGRHFPLADIFYVEKVIPRMIAKALAGTMSPPQAVSWAAEEMRRIAAEQRSDK